MWLIPPSLTLILRKDMMISAADEETFAMVSYFSVIFA